MISAFSSVLSRSLIYMMSLPSTFVPVVRLKAELFFVPSRSVSACFLEVSFPFVLSLLLSFFSLSISFFSVFPPSSPTSTARGIFPSLARLCSSRYLAHPLRDYRNFLGTTTSCCSAFPPFLSFRGVDLRKRNSQRICILR